LIAVWFHLAPLALAMLASSRGRKSRRGRQRYKSVASARASDIIARLNLAATYASR
jgi:hypothetical protein